MNVLRRVAPWFCNILVRVLRIYTTNGSCAVLFESELGAEPYQNKK